MNPPGEFLLDTNIVIAMIKRDPNVLFQVNASRILLPVPVVGELKYGALLSSRSQESLDRIDDLIATCEVVGIDVHTTAHYATIRRSLQVKGRPIPENDIWIAALSRQHDLPLVTRDRDFEAIEGLALVQW